MTTEKIYIQIDNERIEATGKVLEDLLADIAENKAKEAEFEARQAAKASLIQKLMALGITEEEARQL